jgi:hypothetical protein
MGELRGGRSKAIGGRVKGPPPTTTLERPPPGPARGAFAAPPWLVALLSVALVALAGFALVRAYRRRLK